MIPLLLLFLFHLIPAPLFITPLSPRLTVVSPNASAPLRAICLLETLEISMFHKFLFYTLVYVFRSLFFFSLHYMSVFARCVSVPVYLRCVWRVIPLSGRY